MKVFISQPMKGRVASAIQEEREDALKELKKLFPNKTVEELDTHFKKEVDSPLYCLGKSIQFMGKADLIVFIGKWKTARGCSVELATACAYGLPILRLDEDTEPWIYDGEVGKRPCEVLN